MISNEDPDTLLAEYKKYTRFDFLVLYGLVLAFLILGKWTGIALSEFQRKYVQPRKDRISTIKKMLPHSHRKRAYSYFCIRYTFLIWVLPLASILGVYLLGFTIHWKLIAPVGIFALIASSGYIVAYYGLIEGQELDSLIWSEDGYKKENDPKTRNKLPF